MDFQNNTYTSTNYLIKRQTICYLWVSCKTWN